MRCCQSYFRWNQGQFRGCQNNSVASAASVGFRAARRRTESGISVRMPLLFRKQNALSVRCCLDEFLLPLLLNEVVVFVVVVVVLADAEVMLML